MMPEERRMPPRLVLAMLHTTLLKCIALTTATEPSLSLCTRSLESSDHKTGLHVNSSRVAHPGRPQPWLLAPPSLETGGTIMETIPDGPQMGLESERPSGRRFETSEY